jgi:hypothetical protein
MRTDHRRRTYWLQEQIGSISKGWSDQQPLTEWCLPFWPGQYTSFLGRLVTSVLGRMVHIVLSRMVHTSLPRDRADKQSITDGREGKQAGTAPNGECGFSISVSRGSELRAQYYRRQSQATTKRFSRGTSNFSILSACRFVPEGLFPKGFNCPGCCLSQSDARRPASAICAAVIPDWSDCLQALLASLILFPVSSDKENHI